MQVYLDKIAREAHKARIYSKLVDPLCVLLAVSSLLFLADRIFYESEMSRYTISAAQNIVVAVFFVIIFMIIVSRPWRRVRTDELEEEILRIDIKAETQGRLMTYYEIKDESNSFKEALRKDTEKNLSRLNISRMFTQEKKHPVRYSGVFALVTLLILIVAPAGSYEKPICDFSSDLTKGIAPLAVRFFDASIGYIDDHEWEMGGAGYNNQNAIHVFSRPGFYPVKHRVIGPGGEDILTRPDYITVYPPGHPLADFDLNPVTGRCPLTVTFRNLSMNSDRFEWNFGDGAISKEREPRHVYTKPGIYSPSLTSYKGDHSDVTVKKDVVVVVDEDGIVADFTALPIEGKAPLTVQFEDRSSGTIKEFRWDFGSRQKDSTSSDRNPSYVYRIPGYYTVTLYVNGLNGMSTAVKKHYIEVHDKDAGGSGFSIAGLLRELYNSLAQVKKPGTDEGKLFGAKTERPKTEKVPLDVKPLEKEGPLVEKDKKIFTSKNPNGKDPEEIPYKDAYNFYSRIKEDAINSERIPRELRDLVREYFELIKPQ